MIEMLLKTVFENKCKINDVIDYINKLNAKHRLEAIAVVLGMCAVAKVVKNNRERIMFLELELEQMKSKGE